MGTGVLKAQTSADTVNDWGSIVRHGWPISNVTTGGATMSGDSYPQGAWGTLRGGFTDTLKATTSQAAVVTGKLIFLGGDPTSWSALRFGLFRHDSTGTLEYTGTDSVRWDGQEDNAYGYMFSPHSGVNDQVSGQGGNGTQWAVDGGTWLSTWSGGTITMGVFDQAPRRAELSQGTYDFAISVMPQGDGTNEVKWYLIKEDNSYWIGGTAIDTGQVSTSFNGICFGINNGNGIENTTVNGLTVSDVTAKLGNPITIPTAPFSSFYVSDWGSLNRAGWPILNDSTTRVGDASMGSDGPPQGAWATVRGGFGIDVKATMTEAIVVTGQLTFTGSPTSWSALRYGLFRHDSVGTLHYQYTDSAAWGNILYVGTDSSRFEKGHEDDAYGYLFTPHSGVNDPVGGNGGNGTSWADNGGSWISSYGGVTMGVVDQAPRRAEMTAGTYNFAISVQPQSDGTNEVRWYLIKDDNSYWIGGTSTDTAQVSTDFNGVVFGVNNGNGIGDTDVTQLDVSSVKVDLGSPITIPDAPFSDFYVSDWGFLGGKLGGTSETDSAWALTPGSRVGDVSVSGDAATGWAVIGGGFGTNITPNEASGKAIVVDGSITFDGGSFEDANSFRFGLYNADNMGSLDSTMKVGFVWSGNDTTSGYLFVPDNGSSSAPTWTDGTGNTGATNGGAWYDPAGIGAYGLSTIQATGTPTAGKYNFKISVQPNADGHNEIRVDFEKDDGSYVYKGSAVDTKSMVAASSFNSIIFGTNNSTTTSMMLEAVHVNMGNQIDLPIQSDNTTGLPTKFALKQNYPNPFNPTTNIKFDLPKSSDVELSLYNILGQKVMTLVNQKMQAGYHQINFDARNLASGMYIYRIKAGNFVSVKKMMLIK